MALRADRRPLIYAIGFSLALHVLVLGMRLPSPTGGSRAAPAIVAHLIPAEEPAAAALAISNPAPKARPVRRSVPAAPSEALPSMPSAEPALDEATAIGRYRYELIGTALRYKRYPAEAIEAGWEGEVLVHVAIAGSGVADVSVKASSGQPLLDEQALAAFRAAAPLVPLPSRLRGQAFGVEVRAVYSLKD